MTKEFTSDQINFFKTLNSLLMRKEKELFERCKTLFETYQKRLKKNGGDLWDYEIDVMVEFSLSGYHRKYICMPTINKGMLDPKDRTFGSEEDWSERSTGTFPDIGERMCYLMHCLYYHSSMKNKDKSFFKIIRIDFEIIIREQQFEDVVDYEVF